MSPDEARRAARAEAGYWSTSRTKCATCASGTASIHPAGHSLWRSPAQPLAGIHHARRTHHRTRHRREQRDLQRHQRRRSEAAGLSGARPLDVHHQPVPEAQLHALLGLAARIFRIRGAHESVLEIGAYTAGAANLSQGDSPERVNVASMTASTVHVLGVKPARGRYSPPTRISRTRSPSSHCRTSCGSGRSAAIRRSSESRSTSVPQTQVLGVMPPGFDIHDARAQLWSPAELFIPPIARTARRTCSTSSGASPMA